MRVQPLLRTVLPWAFVVSVLFCAPASAQVDTGTILGMVKDESGGVLPRATVTITHEGQAFTLTTVARDDGTYIFTPIRTGAYSVEVEFQGFKKGVRKGITVGIQQQAVVDFTLSAGGLAEEVVVTGESPLLQTGSGTVGETLKGSTIENLPINGRDYTILARLSTGVVPPQPGARAPLMFSANGVRPAQNNYLLDGIDNNTSNVDFLSGVAYIVKPPVDAVDEIKVMTSSFSAEYGRAGGAVLNTTLKSGTSRFRGSAWEFYRNDALNANDFFANRANIKKGEYLSNQYGATAGGPAWGTKTFWFADYEGSIIQQARTWVRTVPTALQRASGFTNFSDLTVLQSGTIAADVLGRSFARGTVFDPATTRQLQLGQLDPVTGLVATRSGLRPRCVPRQPDSSGPHRSKRPSTDAALPRAQPVRIEQQLHGEQDQHRRHALVRRPGRPQLQHEGSLLRPLQLLGQPQDPPIPVRRRCRWWRFQRRRREGARGWLCGEPHAHVRADLDQRGAGRFQPGAHEQAAAERRQPGATCRRSTGFWASRSSTAMAVCRRCVRRTCRSWATTAGSSASASATRCNSATT